MGNFLFSSEKTHLNNLKKYFSAIKQSNLCRDKPIGLFMNIATLPPAVMGQRIIDFLVFWSKFLPFSNLIAFSYIVDIAKNQKLYPPMTSSSMDRLKPTKSHRLNSLRLPKQRDHTYSTRIESAGKSSSGPFRGFRGVVRGAGGILAEWGNFCLLSVCIKEMREYTRLAQLRQTFYIYVQTWAQFMS